jgi:RNA polymerase sigma factor (sigma-70 family)
VEHLRKTVLQWEEDTLSDGELLARFVEKQDTFAFAALVRRHGPMVWGVCQRIAGQVADAEDAFQAAFLILVRKAAVVKPRETVGNWLYGVACHTALKAMTTSAKLHAKEKQVMNMPDPAKVRRDDWEELQMLLDQEMSSLPEKYRLPVVLCDLEGRTRKEVAAQLKIPEGTLSSRLATAHQMLAKRMARHRLALSGGSLAALLAQNAASACWPASVVSSTIKTATLVAASNGVVAGVVSTKVAALTEGVMKAMLLTKLKIAGVLWVLVMLGVGTGVYTIAVAGDEQPETTKRENSATKELSLAAQSQKEKPKEDKDLMLGTWKIVSTERNGKGVTDEGTEGDTTVITADTITISCKSGGKLVLTYRLDPSQRPKAIDVTPHKPDPSAGDVLLGIYELKGDQLKICFSRNVALGAARPNKFSADERGDRFYILERSPAAKAKVEPKVDDLQKPIDPKLLAKLAAELRSNEWEEKSTAVRTLAKLLAAKGFGDTDFGPVIEPLFLNAGWGGIAKDNARLAEDCLVRIQDQAVPFLRQRLKSADAHDRRVAAELLVRIGPLEATLAKLLQPLLTDPDDYVRMAAIDGLGNLGASAKATITDLERVATNDPNLARRVGARIALIRVDGVSKERVRALAAFLEMKDNVLDQGKGGKNQARKEAAVYAASALGELGPKARSAEAQLVAALKNPEVRHIAARVLGQINADSPEAIAVLIDILKNDPRTEARRSAAGSLGAFGPAAKAAIPVLREALKGDEKEGWWVAADALAKIGGAEVVPILMEALTNPDEDIRLASIRGLGDLGVVARPALIVLQKARLEDPRAGNRAAAAAAVQKVEWAIQDK